MPKLFIHLMIITAFLTSCVEESIIRPKEMLCEGKLNPTGIATTVPHFSWKNEATANKSYQTSYQILVASSASQLEEGNADLWNTGKVESPKSVLVKYGGQALRSRSVAYWKIRVWDHSDTPSEWSQIQSFSVGLLNAEDWQADYIGMRSDNSDLQSPFIRKSFELDEPCKEVYFHVNSLGYHELYINGQKAGDAVLAPAESQFDKRSFSLSYDVSPYLQPGENTIVLWLGYGWYKHFRGKAHDGPLVKAQLDGLKNGTWETLLKTDDSWRISESEYSILDNNKFGGEILNLSKRIPGFADQEFDDSSWEHAAKFEVSEHLVTPQVVELNRVQEQIIPNEISMPEDQVYLVDMGKNLTGTVSIRFPELPKGHEVTIQYADHLASKNSELYALQSNKPGYNVTDREQQIFNRQTVKYISSGEHGVFINKFNYRAFRYIKISNMPGPLHKDSITAQLVHTDFRPSASYTSSDEMLNQIHDLFAYTLKCLTLGGKMVDCPHYERLGYGGDGNASTMTAQTLFDLSSLYTTWLTHWADYNKPDGDMPHTAPSYWSSGGGPYWCTFIIKATWETYLNYGDKRVLETFYPNMLNWLGYVKKYSPNILLEQWPATEDRNWYLGDWATPEGVDQTDPRSVGLVTNCAIVDSYDKMIKIAGVLNRSDDLEHFKAMKKELSQAVHQEYYNPESATYATGVQIDLAYPLLLDIVPDASGKACSQKVSTGRIVAGHLSS